MAKASGKTIKLNMIDAHKIILALRSKQDYCNYIVHSESPNSETFRKLVDELEVLKMKIVKQMG